jgi:quinol monooxygenase YgiN
MIRVVAVLTTKPGRRDELLAACKAILPVVRAEEGCVEYAPYIDADGIGAFQAKFGPDTLVILETWESPEALAAHAVADHMKEYGKKIRDLLESRAIHVLSAA